MRYHVLGLAHTISTPEYSSCAFTAKVVKLCRMLQDRGHYVIHYGNEASRVVCDQHITVTTLRDLDESYPGHDWRKLGFPAFDLRDKVYETFNRNTIAALRDLAKPGDFLCCPFGAGHRVVAEAAPEGVIVSETGVGYPGGWFARWRAFESDSIMHIALGQEQGFRVNNAMWQDVVIPNAFDLDDFSYRDRKDDYFLFLGRIGEGKGTHIAADVCRRLGLRLVVAGPGVPDPAWGPVEHVGVVGPHERSALLSGARAVFCPSTYLEPFCGVQVEAYLSGTPVISTDWAAFREYNLHGVTGYRCRTMDHFLWAAREVERISPHACRQWGLNFTLERIGAMYEEWFQILADVHTPDGWYRERPDRRELNWLRMCHPLEWNT